MERRAPDVRRTREERCLCGNLVARATPEGVEILCRRCRRIHRIAWQRAQGIGPASMTAHK